MVRTYQYDNDNVEINLDDSLSSLPHNVESNADELKDLIGLIYRHKSTRDVNKTMRRQALYDIQSPALLWAALNYTRSTFKGEIINVFILQRGADAAAWHKRYNLFSLLNLYRCDLSLDIGGKNLLSLAVSQLSVAGACAPGLIQLVKLFQSTGLRFENEGENTPVTDFFNLVVQYNAELKHKSPAFRKRLINHFFLPLARCVDGLDEQACRQFWQYSADLYEVLKPKIANSLCPVRHPESGGSRLKDLQTLVVSNVQTNRRGYPQLRSG